MSLTRILDLSFSLYPKFYQRDLKNYKDDWDNRSGSNNTYTFGKTGISTSRPGRRHGHQKKSKFRKRRIRQQSYHADDNDPNKRQTLKKTRGGTIAQGKSKKEGI